MEASQREHSRVVMKVHPSREEKSSRKKDLWHTSSWLNDGMKQTHTHRHTHSGLSDRQKHTHTHTHTHTQASPKCDAHCKMPVALQHTERHTQTNAHAHIKTLMLSVLGSNGA